HRLVDVVEAVVADEILVDPRRLQRRLLRQPLVDLGLVRIELRGRASAAAAVDGLHAALQVALDRATVAPGHSSDLRVGQPLTVHGPAVHLPRPTLSADNGSMIESLDVTMVGELSSPALSERAVETARQLLSAPSPDAELDRLYPLLVQHHVAPAILETLRCA